MVRAGLCDGVCLQLRAVPLALEARLCRSPPQRVGDFITGRALFGVIVGGRLGYVFFYKPEMLRDPLSILRVWEGGMSSHGGMMGLLLFTLYYARRYKISWPNLGDNLVVTAPIGLFFGRCANFINGELYGRIANVPWAMQFPKELVEHPEEAGRSRSRARESIRPLLTSDAIVGAVGAGKCRNRTALDSDAATSVATLRSLFRGYRVVPDFVVCPHAHAPTQRRLHRLVLFLLRDLSNRRREFSRTRCRIDWAVHSRTIFLLLPLCDWRALYRGREKASDVSEKNDEARLTKEAHGSNEVARRRVSSLICNLRCSGAQRTARPTDTCTFARAPHGRRPLPWAPNFRRARGLRILPFCVCARGRGLLCMFAWREVVFIHSALNKSPLFVTLVKMTVAFPQKRVITCRGDAGILVPEIVAAGGGLLFAFDHATIAGKIVLTLLAVASIFSWSIMITKLRVIRFARKQTRISSRLFARIDSHFVCSKKTRAFPARPFSTSIAQVARK